LLDLPYREAQYRAYRGTTAALIPDSARTFRAEGEVRRYVRLMTVGVAPNTTQLDSDLKKDPMMNTAISRILLGATPMMMVCGLLLSGTSALAQPTNEPGRRCSNRTLSGNYGAQVTGTILGPDLIVRAVAMAHYDGNGNFTQVDFAVVNGVPQSTDWRPGVGTYAVNPDCTGSAVLIPTPGAAPIFQHFVIVNNGKEILGVVDFGATTVIAKKVE
jgi:hypothetical protein